MRASPEEYEAIEELVKSFQAGNEEAGLELIEVFKPYFTKYARLLQNGLLDLNDIDSRKFISLFISDAEVRRGLVRSYQTTYVRNEAYKAASLLVKLCDPIPEQDLSQEFILSLLILAKRYQKKGKKKNFCGYVYNSYRYELHRRLGQLTKDPLIFRADTNISYHDESNLTDENDNILDNIDLSNTLKKVLEDELDNSWVRGLTCSEIFLGLTQLQRLIIKLYYYEELSDYKIADKLGLHRNTIGNQRTKAVKLIKSYEQDEMHNLR